MVLTPKLLGYLPLSVKCAAFMDKNNNKQPPNLGRLYLFLQYVIKIGYGEGVASPDGLSVSAGDDSACKAAA